MATSHVNGAREALLGQERLQFDEPRRSRAFFSDHRCTGALAKAIVGQRFIPGLLDRERIIAPAIRSSRRCHRSRSCPSI